MGAEVNSSSRFARVAGMGIIANGIRGMGALRDMLAPGHVPRGLVGEHVVPGAVGAHGLDHIEAQAVVVIEEAIRSSALSDSDLEHAAIVGGLGLAEDQVLDGRASTNPLLDRLARRFRIKGTRAATYSACATGTDALGLALLLVRSGEAKDVVVVASDSPVGERTRTAFVRLGVLAEDTACFPAACRAFSADRNGFVLAEGAACVILRSCEYADGTASPHPSVDVIGYGSTIDNHSPVSPNPDGSALTEATRRALRDAALGPEHVDVVSAHGTGTIQNDASEARALAAVLGERTPNVPVVATKPIFGHSIAAAGLIEVVTAVVGLQQEVLHGNPWLWRVDKTLPILPVGRHSIGYRHRVVLKCSTAFGGANAAIVLRRR